MDWNSQDPANPPWSPQTCESAGVQRRLHWILLFTGKHVGGSEGGASSLFRHAKRMIARRQDLGDQPVPNCCARNCHIVQLHRNTRATPLVVIALLFLSCAPCLISPQHLRRSSRSRQFAALRYSLGTLVSQLFGTSRGHLHLSQYNTTPMPAQ